MTDRKPDYVFVVFAKDPSAHLERLPWKASAWRMANQLVRRDHQVTHRIRVFMKDKR